MLYTPKHIKDLDYLRDIGFPGEYPFTRGIYPNMYRGRLWTIRQYAGYASAKESNKRYKYLLAQGQTGLSVAFDLPTQMGYDSDHPLSEGEVGKTGVAIDSLLDMEALFDGIPLDKVSTSMTINSTAPILLAMYIAVANKQGVSRELLSGTVQNDILKEYIARGTYIFPPVPSMRLTIDIFEYCSKYLPKWNTISISGYHIREAGATAVQELAFTLANAIAYVEAAIARGLTVDSFAPRLSFFFNAHNDFFEEIAKFRAARRLWAKIMKERFNAKDPKSWMLRFHAQTAGCTLTAQQPENNAVRVAFQSLAAVLGGTQSLHTNSMDEALALPSEEAVRLALRTQQLIAYESGVPNTIDPLGGSYYIESLTKDIEAKAMEYINKIDSIGGALKAVEIGYFQHEIHNSAYEYQKAIESGKKVVVGVNRFVEGEEDYTKNILKVDPKVREEQIVRLKKLKSTRDNRKVNASLKTLRDASLSLRSAQGRGSTEDNGNLMEPIIDCVKCYATLGEICSVLREVFGEYKEKFVF
ncbi:MAG: methylmalonyl-CoA mutase family protein [bacterium]|nr:methylmalonyl-CoA mutase family protein [bacterium]